MYLFTRRSAAQPQRQNKIQTPGELCRRSWVEAALYWLQILIVDKKRLIMPGARPGPCRSSCLVCCGRRQTQLEGPGLLQLPVTCWRGLGPGLSSTRRARWPGRIQSRPGSLSLLGADIILGSVMLPMGHASHAPPALLDATATPCSTSCPLLSHRLAMHYRQSSHRLDRDGDWASGHG